MPSVSATRRASWMSCPAQQAPGPVRRRAMVVELQRDAHDVVTGRFDQTGHDGGIDAAGHGDDDARAPALSREAEVDVDHGSSLQAATIAQSTAAASRHLKNP